ncbi:polyketide beta-ketoacyl:ACP synthase [Burkholderia gladioli]|nr:beta-ketoacyl synthase N-terminal-like domain-containing protein [Burkholderia gladioli]KAF1059884.1 Polyketide biosynthesis malonyl-ACP decarboxylase PksF [Burkholderia gladioli]MBJ9679657.1 polyketide beta-ketoacyl:ACP synthase [Burkholderia gladioli]MDN7462004.1 beta-ketoacyl synthase N-terminal-like domain-containing protein [Burkholderia gladioli]WAG23949.1 polyketide beta-ketoacyl:ACP synthase [Burkholderia gladioli]
MPASSMHEAVVTGLGVVSAIGQGSAPFLDALLEARAAFRVMRRPGRQRDSAFLGAEIDELVMPPRFDAKTLRRASFSSRAALATLDEAWRDARLDAVDTERIGLVVGGSNTQQRELMLMREAHAAQPEYLSPSYGLAWLDSDLCGFCTEQFGIRGPAYTVGGASASGQLAVIEALRAVRSGELDACIALGAPSDLSYWECQGLRSLGAMGSTRHADKPGLACRPFDRDRDGFIFGEACAALVVESERSARARGVAAYARLDGAGLASDANRQPDPSPAGEARAIRMALRDAGCTAADIDYVNTHGTGSPLGDEVELQALRECGLAHAALNATKSITGHALSAAGALELVATLLQMRAGRLHATRNLAQPIDPSLNWVPASGSHVRVRTALSLSHGFGGINTAVCLSNCS